MEGSPMDPQEKAALMATVKRLKVILDNSATKDRDQVLVALDQLQSLKSLPTDVLKETLIGKSLHGMAKSVEDPEIRSKAKTLELAWRQDFKKRKASTDELQLRRCNSNVSEGTSPGLSLASRSFSQDLESEAMVSGSEARPLERATSNVSVASAASAAASQGDAKKDDAYRDKVRAKLMEALGKDDFEEVAGEGETRDGMRDPVKLAEEIEEELHKAMPKKEAYMNQARSLLFNLKDAKNPTFKFKLMVGFFQPAQLPTLTAEDMASEQKNDERRKQRKYAMEALDQGWALKNGQQPTTGMFTCGKCKGNKTTYFQMQTRSSDEPMTTFVTCLTCSNRWKFC